jgi:Domain of unknown function (DUF4328)
MAQSPCSCAFSRMPESAIPPDQSSSEPAPAQRSVTSDARQFWDGERWRSTLSADGQWLWDGQEWVPVAPPPPLSVTGYKPAATRTTAAKAALIAIGACDALWAVAKAVNVVTGGTANFERIPSLLALLAYVACAIAVPMWCFRATGNLGSLSDRFQRFTPGWAAGWWFVPVANLVQPYRVLREIWTGSRPNSEPWSILKWGWAAYLIGDLLGNFYITLDDPVSSFNTTETVRAAGLIFRVLGALLAFEFVRRVGDWQVKAHAHSLPERS